jgi:transposase, IS5 family
MIGSWRWRNQAAWSQGRKLRVDTTAVESNIHYPTDRGLLNDGARVLTRTMKKD